MDKKLGTLFIVLLASIIIGVSQPALLYAGEGSIGNPWDPFVTTKIPNGNYTTLTGTLSLIYNSGYLPNFDPKGCSLLGLTQGAMYYSVRFSYNNVFPNYEGSTAVCLGDFGTVGSGGQGDIVMAFLDSAVQSTLGVPPGTKWYLTKVKNPGISSYVLSFTADIVIKVKNP
jgi:hypothetical protein